MVAGVRKAADGWAWDVASVGLPAPIRGGKVISEPVNLGDGWVGFDFEAALGKPTKVVNDAVMQAVGSYEGGRMLFLGLGTGLGSALIIDGVVEPMELGHLPFRKQTFEDYVGVRAMEKRGRKRWRKDVFDVVVCGHGGLEHVLPDPPKWKKGSAFVVGVDLRVLEVISV